jgi:hypothetical protein
MKRTMTPREVAIERGCTLDFIYRELWAGKYPGAEKVGKVWRIPAGTVKAHGESRGNDGNR